MKTEVTPPQLYLDSVYKPRIVHSNKSNQ